jgi:uncharacterized protein YndB with AHSA1/START domain
MKWESSASVLMAASPAVVWDALLDGRRWNNWNPGVQWMVIEDDVAPGGLLTMKPKGAPQTAFLIEDVSAQERLAVRITFGPLATMQLRWTLAPLGDGTRFEQTVAISGIAAGWLLKKAATKIATAMPGNLERLAALCTATAAV